MIHARSYDFHSLSEEEVHELVKIYLRQEADMFRQDKLDKMRGRKTKIESEDCLIDEGEEL